MPNSKSMCGAETKAHGTCRQLVATPGQRCHLHKGKPLGAKLILPLMYRVIEKVATVHGAYAAYEQAYPAIESSLRHLWGLIMPEYFWDYGFKPKDRGRMLEEIVAARRKSNELQLKYAHYSTKDRLAIEKAYREILEALDSHRQGT